MHVLPATVHFSTRQLASQLWLAKRATPPLAVASMTSPGRTVIR
jgi:hypothetical protein